MQRRLTLTIVPIAGVGGRGELLLAAEHQVYDLVDQRPDRGQPLRAALIPGGEDDRADARPADVRRGVVGNREHLLHGHVLEDHGGREAVDRVLGGKLEHRLGDLGVGPTHEDALHVVVLAVRRALVLWDA